MPLYESLSKKSPASKQKTSLYSLTSRRDPKTASTSRSSSQLTLYGTSPDAKTLLALRRNAQKSTPDLGIRTPPETDHFINAQKSTPDLTFNRPGWNSETSSVSKYSAGASVTSGSISNLIISPSTASNFIYKPEENDSHANLFSETGKTSSTSAITNFTSQLPTTSKRSELDGAPVINPAPLWSALPPLESTLENILNSDSRQASDSRNFPKSDQNFIELSSAKLGKLPTRASPNLASIDNETKMETAEFDYDNLHRKHDNKEFEKLKESGGLGDYLQSLKSPKYQNPNRKDDNVTRSPNSPN